MRVCDVEIKKNIIYTYVHVSVQGMLISVFWKSLFKAIDLTGRITIFYNKNTPSKNYIYLIIVIVY